MERGDSRRKMELTKDGLLVAKELDTRGFDPFEERFERKQTERAQRQQERERRRREEIERYSKKKRADAALGPPLNLIEIVPRKIYAYNHWLTVRPTWVVADTKLVLAKAKRKVIGKLRPVIDLIGTMVQVFPKILLLYPDRERQEIILIDPIGREIPEKELTDWSDSQREYFLAHQHLLKPDYAQILRQFIFEVTGRYEDLKNYKIRILISHAHPDHWTGLSTLITDSRIFKRGTKPDVLLPKGILENIRDYTVGYRIPELNEVCDPQFVQNTARIINIFYGDITPYQELFGGDLKDRPITISLLDTPQWKLPHGPLGINWCSLNMLNGSKKTLIPTPQFEWAFPQGVHSSNSIVFRYTPITSTLTKKIIFLNDIFPLVPALSTTTPPRSSFQAFQEFYKLLREEGSFRFIWSHYYPIGRRFNNFLESLGPGWRTPILEEGFLYGYTGEKVRSEISQTIRDSFKKVNGREMDDVHENESSHLKAFLRWGHVRLLIQQLNQVKEGDFYQQARKEPLVKLFNEESMNFLWSPQVRRDFEKLYGRFVMGVSNILNCGRRPSQCRLLRIDNHPYYSTVPGRGNYVAYLSGSEEKLEITRRLGKYCIFICNTQLKEENR